MTTFIRSPLILAVVIFGLALGTRLTDLGVFVGPDEFSWVTRSANFTQALVNGDLAQTYQTGHPGVTLMWAETLGSWLRFWGGSTWPVALAADKTMAALESKRQIIAVTNTLIIAAAVLLLYRIFGVGVAWIAGFLLAFDPFLLTESRALRTEGLATGFGILALLVLLLYLKEQSWRYLILAGIVTGLALLSKISAVGLLPVGAVVMVVAAWVKQYPQANGPQPRHASLLTHLPLAILRLLIWAGMIGLTILALWPALWVSPVEVARHMVAYVSLRAVEGEGGGSGTFFLGQPVDYEELGLLFYPLVLLYRTGPWVCLGLILLGVRVWWRKRKVIGNGGKEEGQSPQSYPVLSALPLSVIAMLLYLVIYLVLITQSDLKFDRYIIPMLPPLDILAAVGLVAAWHWLTSWLAGVSRFAWGGALLLLILQMAWTLPHHPYYYAYWNPLLGGLKQAVQLLPVGEGEGIDQVAAYLNSLSRPETIKLASANSQKIAPLFKGQTIAMSNLDGLWTLGDYVFIYISQLQRGKHDPNIISYLRRQAPVYTLTLHGVEYSWIYPGPAAQFYGGGNTLEGRGSLYGYSLFPNFSSTERESGHAIGNEAGARVELAAGESLKLRLYWRVEGHQENDRFFARLLDLDGYVWVEAIAQPRPGFEETSRQENAIVESEATLNLPIGMPPGDYFFKPGFRTAAGQIIGYFDLPSATKPIHVTVPETYPTVPTFQPPEPARLTANQDLALLGYRLDPASAAPGAELWLTLYWQALTPVTHDYVILVRILAETGSELAYWLGRPVRSGYPTTAWQVKQVVQDPWRLTLPATAKPGSYTLEIALFDAATEIEVIRQKLGSLTVTSE